MPDNKLIDFINKYSDEADSVLLNEEDKLTFFAGSDPIKKLTATQIKEFNIIMNEYEEKLRDDEAIALQKQSEKEIELIVKEANKPQAVKLKSDSDLPTVPARHV